MSDCTNGDDGDWPDTDEPIGTVKLETVTDSDDGTDSINEGGSFSMTGETIDPFAKDGNNE